MLPANMVRIHAARPTRVTSPGATGSGAVPDGSARNDPRNRASLPWRTKYGLKDHGSK